jgi:hypothetical protein
MTEPTDIFPLSGWGSVEGRLGHYSWRKSDLLPSARRNQPEAALVPQRVECVEDGKAFALGPPCPDQNQEHGTSTPHRDSAL